LNHQPWANIPVFMNEMAGRKNKNYHSIQLSNF